MEKQTCVISIQSAGVEGGDLAEIMINDVQVKVKKNKNDHLRGLHVVVLNFMGLVETARVFDTYESSAEFDKFIATEIPHGYIVLAASKDDCVKKLSKDGKRFFTKMGSTEIKRLGYRCSFVFIGTAGEKGMCHEKRAKRPKDKVNVQQIIQVDNDPGFSESESEVVEKPIIPEKDEGEFHPIDYYLLKEGETDPDPVIPTFKKWCAKEGVLMPKLEFPATFENGLVGMKCKETIENREAYLYVPYKMMLSAKMVSSDPVLGPLISENPECFE